VQEIKEIKMIKGLVITPPTVGRISIGKVVEKNGKRLPEKDDQFTITSQIQSRDGGWINHPLDDELRKAQGGKIRTIPVTMLFDDPELNFRASYTAFDRKTGRPMCVGDGESCKRSTLDGVVQLDCPTPSGCEVGAGGQCKPYGRLNVVIGEDDATGTFVFRTTGYNSIRTLTARLQYFKALSADKLSCMPLELKLRGKSTTQSFGAPIFYVDLTPRTGQSLEQSLVQASERHEARQASGFDQKALDAAALVGFSNGVFVDSEEETDAVVEEFYSQFGQGTDVQVSQAQIGQAQDAHSHDSENANTELSTAARQPMERHNTRHNTRATTRAATRTTLSDKLQQKTQALPGNTGVPMAQEV
jgi:hypothetical protein